MNQKKLLSFLPIKTRLFEVIFLFRTRQNRPNRHWLKIPFIPFFTPKLPPTLKKREQL
jgi:hypothetical protein